MPQLSVETGTYLLSSLVAAESNRDVGIILPGNGNPVVGSFSVIAFAWHPPADVAASSIEKFPASVNAVGTCAVLVAGLLRCTVCWYPPKKNNLSRIILPPAVPPN